MDWTTAQRLACLGGLFALELIALSVWLDTARLSKGSVLTSAIAGAGPHVLRGIIGFSTVFVTFSILKYRTIPGSSRLERPRRIRWELLAAHAAAMGVFTGLSAWLFSPSPARLDLLAPGWLVAGLGGIGFAAAAFVPSANWIQSIRVTRNLFLWALAAAVAVAYAGDSPRILWIPLGKLTYGLVAALLRLFVASVVSDPAKMLIGTSNFQVVIAPECSGFEGMGLILAFGAVWLALFRKESRFPQALLLLPAGVLFIYLLNIVRITSLVLIGDAGAPEIAARGFHSQAGWIGFSVACLVFSMTARRLPWITSRPAKAQAPAATGNPTAAYLLPFLAILVAGMAATAMSAGFEWLYGLRLIAAGAALFYFRRSFRCLEWGLGWQGIAGGGLVFVIWVVCERWNGGLAAHGMPAELAAASGGMRFAWIAARAAAGVVTVPIAEELAFRGFLLRRLVSADFEHALWRRAPVWPSLLVSSLLFGLMHGQRWVAGTLAGLIFGLLPMRSGKFGDSVAAHAVANGLIAVSVLVFGQWQLW